MRHGTDQRGTTSEGSMKTATPFLRVIAALAIVIGVSAIPLAQVAACSCMATVPAEAAAMADAAFTGTVVGEEPAAGDLAGPNPLGQIVYTFAVDGVAKGDVGAETTVLAGGDSAGCGMSFASNERWLIFAAADGGRLNTGLCSGNVPLAADEEPPVSVAAPTSPAATDSGGGVPVAVILPVTALVALVGASAFLFWRADRATAK